MSPETVLITGCSSGIGAATAVHLAGRGYRVFASMRAPDTRNAGAAERLLRATPTGGLRVLELDVTDARSIERAVGQIQLEGGLDALVHNAGVAAIGLTEAHSADAAARLFDVNVLGALRVQQATLPLLRESAAPRIVGVSSTLGREQAPFLALYTASKHAFAALLSTWAYELHPEGIRTCLVEPGTFPSTGMLQALLPADRRPPAHTEPLAARAAALRDGLRAFGAGPDAPDPHAVAVAIERALGAGAPDRIVVDPSGFDGCARVDDLAETVQRELLARYAMGDLLKPAGC